MRFLRTMRLLRGFTGFFLLDDLCFVVFLWYLYKFAMKGDGKKVRLCRIILTVILLEQAVVGIVYYLILYDEVATSGLLVLWFICRLLWWVTLGLFALKLTDYEYLITCLNEASVEIMNITWSHPYPTTTAFSVILA